MNIDVLEHSSLYNLTAFIYWGIWYIKMSILYHLGWHHVLYVIVLESCMFTCLKKQEKCGSRCCLMKMSVWFLCWYLSRSCQVKDWINLKCPQMNHTVSSVSQTNTTVVKYGNSVNLCYCRLAEKPDDTQKLIPLSFHVPQKMNRSDFCARKTFSKKASTTPNPPKISWHELFWVHQGIKFKAIKPSFVTAAYMNVVVLFLYTYIHTERERESLMSLMSQLFWSWVWICHPSMWPRGDDKSPHKKNRLCSERNDRNLLSVTN